MAAARLIPAYHIPSVPVRDEVFHHHLLTGRGIIFEREKKIKTVVYALNTGNGDSGSSGGRESVEGEQIAQAAPGEGKGGRLFGDDSPFMEGPLETVRPRFSREIPDSVPLNQPSPSSTLGGGKRRGRRRGPFKKPEPSQAVVGAVIAGACTWLLYVGSLRAYAFVAANPPATADLPLGLTDEVNSLALSLVVFLGGMSVSLFGSAALGLLLLAASILSKDPTPPKT